LVVVAVVFEVVVEVVLLLVVVVAVVVVANGLIGSIHGQIRRPVPLYSSLQ
jgi:hypothetical protein